MILFLQQALQLPQLHQLQVSLIMLCLQSWKWGGLFIFMLLAGHCACSDQAWLDVEAISWQPTSGLNECVYIYKRKEDGIPKKLKPETANQF